MAGGKKTTNRPNTSWEPVANWYDKHLGSGGKDTYHGEVIIPRVLELVARYSPTDPAQTALLDLACGQGVFARAAHSQKYDVTGVDASSQLIQLAKKHSPNIKYLVSDARRLNQLTSDSFDVTVCILALQNIDDINIVFKEVARTSKRGSTFIFTINHPMFRIPRQSGWGWDEVRKLQYRRVDSYYSNQKIPIIAHPGQERSAVTWSFHRPLEHYIKALSQVGFSVVDLEEWLSHKTSEKGARSKAEDRARNEIPMFMTIVAKLV